MQINNSRESDILNALSPLSAQGLDITALARLLTCMAADNQILAHKVAQQEQTIAQMSMLLESLRPHEHPGQ